VSSIFWVVEPGYRMHQSIQMVLRSPLVFMVAVTSVFLIAALLISDLAEKKRQRKLRELVERSRLHQSGHAASLAPAAVPANGPGRERRGSRFFENRLLWSGIVAVAVLLMLLVWLPSARTARARAMTPDGASATPGTPVNPVGKQGRRDAPGIPARTGSTNFLAQRDDVLTGSPGRQQPAGVIPPRRASVPITISAPKTPLVDPDLPTSVDWALVKSVHPDPAEVPKPPAVRPPALLR
jgi:hypothetical protein